MILNFLGNILKWQKDMGGLILIIQFIESNMSKIVILTRNQYKKFLMRYFIFFLYCLQNLVLIPPPLCVSIQTLNCPRMYLICIWIS